MTVTGDDFVLLALAGALKTLGVSGSVDDTFKPMSVPELNLEIGILDRNAKERGGFYFENWKKNRSVDSNLESILDASILARVGAASISSLHQVPPPKT